MRITQTRKAWVMKMVDKYAKQLGIPQDDYPTVIFSAKEMNVLYGHKATAKNTFYNRHQGTCDTYNSQISINLSQHKSNDKIELLKTIIHELLHYRFYGLRHSNHTTMAKFETLVNLVLEEGKTDKSLLHGRKKEYRLIREQKNKPCITKRNGKTIVRYAYTNKVNKQVQKVQYKVKFYKSVHPHNKTKLDGTKYPALFGYVDGYPDLTFYYSSAYTPLYKFPIQRLLTGILKGLRQKIRHRLHNKDRSVHITLDYDKTIDYVAMLKEGEDIEGATAKEK